MLKNHFFVYACYFICISTLTVLLTQGPLYANPPWADNIDADSGLTWGSLIKGEIPENKYSEFIEPQLKYFRKTFGPDISSSYDLYQKILARPAADMDSENRDPRLLEIKTLKRWPDPVIIHGRDLPDWEGKQIGRLRLYAFLVDKFVAIPYQFDEFTPAGIKVLPDGGPEANPEDGDGFYSAQDEFMFMAHDLGDRIKVDQFIKGYTDVLEITIEDPLTKEKAWCYLLEFPDTPPARSPLNYATYVEKYNQQCGYYIFVQTSYKVVNGNLYKQIFPQTTRIPKHAGGNCLDYSDRVKFRVLIRLFFGTVKINITEDQLTGDTLAIRDGPIRCTRRCWSKIILKGIQLPKVASIIADITQYDTLFVNPVNLFVPINPGLLWTDFTLYSGTDLSDNTHGSYWYNSNNLDGFLINGKMSEEEKDMDESIDSWRLATGEWGTMMNRSIWDPNFQRQAKIKICYTDDAIGDPPDYDPGHVGMAYNYSTLRSIKPGLYPTELDWYFIPWFNSKESVGKLNMESVNAHLNMYDHPVEIIAGQQRFVNQPKPKGKQIAKDEKK